MLPLGIGEVDTVQAWLVTPIRRRLPDLESPGASVARGGGPWSRLSEVLGLKSKPGCGQGCAASGGSGAGPSCPFNILGVQALLTWMHHTLALASSTPCAVPRLPLIRTWLPGRSPPLTRNCSLAQDPPPAPRQHNLIPGPAPSRGDICLGRATVQSLVTLGKTLGLSFGLNGIGSLFACLRKL